MKKMNVPINYIEFKAKDLDKIKEFYTKAFDWKFTDYGPTYTAFSNSGVEGGFEKTEEKISNGVLVVLRHDNLESVRDNIKSLGGEITLDIFSFPGGERFQFKDPDGNELAVWREV